MLLVAVALLAPVPVPVAVGVDVAMVDVAVALDVELDVVAVAAFDVAAEVPVVFCTVSLAVWVADSELGSSGMGGSSGATVVAAGPAEALASGAGRGFSSSFPFRR